MQDEPTPAELIKSVADFLRDSIAPGVTGHAGFKLRVGINALDLVVRQLTQASAADAEELTRLRALLDVDGALLELNRTLCERIAAGEMDLSSPGLADHLWRTTLAKLAVDQPNYASYRRETESND